MRKVLEFKALAFDTAAELDAAVNELLNEGWELHGDTQIRTTCTDHTFWITYAQAMIKTDLPRL